MSECEMLLPNIVNSIGLTFDIVGVVLLFSGGPPWGSLDRVGRRSGIGLGLLVFGFFLQIVSNHLCALGWLFD